MSEAADGVDAVEKAHEVQPDLILIDIALPRLNGIDAAKQVRSRSPESAIPFVSVEHSDDFVEAALADGARGAIANPK